MMLWKNYEFGLKTPSYKMIGNPIRLLRVAWDSTKLAVQVIAKNKQRAVVVSENQQAVAKQYRSDSYFTKCLNVDNIWQVIFPVRKWALTLCKMDHTLSMNINNMLECRLINCVHFCLRGHLYLQKETVKNWSVRAMTKRIFYRHF